MTDIVPCPACGGTGVVPAEAGDEDDHLTVVGAEQTASDRDQTWSDHDQTSSDRDQRSADEDQQASDQTLAAGGDPTVHEQTSRARMHTMRDRTEVSKLRDEVSEGRFLTAEQRDRLADLRDRVAEDRDRLARLQDQHDTRATKEDVLVRAQRDRARAAADRAKAAEDRARAAADREAAALDRAEARRAHLESSQDLQLAATDELTGAWTRNFGLPEVSREIERANRTGGKLVLAFIDVDGLKTINDTEGHPAGDRLLQAVVSTLRANVRTYDVIVRYGGDEFLCAMPNIDTEGAKQRLAAIATALAAGDRGYSISFGLAAYERGNDLEGLIRRADDDLLRTRGSR